MYHGNAQKPFFVEGVYVGNITGEECVRACAERRCKDANVNGVNMHTDRNLGGCWCERNADVIEKPATYQSCYLAGK